MSAKFPRIKIDHLKCTVPYHCKKCLQICPQACFQILTIKQIKWQETDPQEPGGYKLRATFADKCVVCNRCLEVCPTGALEISL